jgi:hypothetical protein
MFWCSFFFSSINEMANLTKNSYTQLLFDADLIIVVRHKKHWFAILIVIIGKKIKKKICHNHSQWKDFRKDVSVFRELSSASTDIAWVGIPVIPLIYLKGRISSHYTIWQKKKMSLQHIKATAVIWSD